MIKLVVDVANLLFRVAAVQKGKSFGNDEELAGLSMHSALMSVNKYFKKYKPDEVIFAFEGGNNWRKSYSSLPEKKSRIPLQYKANRVYDSSMKHFFELITSFKEVMTLHTSVVCLSVDECEGDDVIAGYVQMYANENDSIIIVSGDRDFVQLLKHPNVVLVNPDTGLKRNQPGDKVYYPDLDYFIFEKCVRGDMGDYAHSAFPRVHKPKIEAAFKDDYARVNFMNNTWMFKEDDGQGNIIEQKFRVGDVFEENKVLLDLSCQPDHIRERMYLEIEREVNNLGKYSNFQMIKFLGQYKLNVILDTIEMYIPLFTANTRSAKTKTEAQEKRVLIDANSLLQF
jgi:hypothetical protein